jgi:hypothetical protein
MVVYRSQDNWSREHFVRFLAEEASSCVSVLFGINSFCSNDGGTRKLWRLKTEYLKRAAKE